MIKVGRNKFVHAALLVCVLMQLAVTLPHHHHDGGEAVCFDYFDNEGGSNFGDSYNGCVDCGGSGYSSCDQDVAIDGYAGDGCDPDSHNCGHHNLPGTKYYHGSRDHHDSHAHTPSHAPGHAPAVCNVHTLIIATPEREDIVIAAAADVHDDLRSSGEQAEARHMASRAAEPLRLDSERSPGAVPLIIEFISYARPSRAPDVLI